MSISICITFVACLFSFAVIINSIFSFLKVRNNIFIDIGLVIFSLFLISLISFYSFVFGKIENKTFIFIFGIFLASIFTFGLINLSLYLINVNKKAVIRIFVLIYVFLCDVVFTILGAFFKYAHTDKIVNLLGIWIPSVISLLIVIIFHKRIKFGLFIKQKIAIIVISIFNVILSAIFKNLPYVFIILVSIIILILYYQYFFSNPIGQKNNQIKKEFISDFNLSKREVEILTELITGKTNKELSQIFFVTEKTIEAHLGNIYKKVGVKNRLELFARIKD